MPEASAVNTAENRPIPSTQEEWEAASARLKESQEAFDRSAQALDKHLTGKSETDPNKKLSETDIQEGVSRADEMISEVQAAINYLSGLRNFSGEPLADITDAIGQLEAQKSNIQALRMQLENARISPAEARALLMGMQAAVGAAVDRASESAHTAASEFKSEIYIAQMNKIAPLPPGMTSSDFFGRELSPEEEREFRERIKRNIEQNVQNAADHEKILAGLKQQYTPEEIAEISKDPVLFGGGIAVARADPQNKDANGFIAAVDAAAEIKGGVAAAPPLSAEDKRKFAEAGGDIRRILGKIDDPEVKKMVEEIIRQRVHTPGMREILEAYTNGTLTRDDVLGQLGTAFEQAKVITAETYKGIFEALPEQARAAMEAAAKDAGMSSEEYFEKVRERISKLSPEQLVGEIQQLAAKADKKPEDWARLGELTIVAASEPRLAAALHNYMSIEKGVSLEQVSLAKAQLEQVEKQIKMQEQLLEDGGNRAAATDPAVLVALKSQRDELKGRVAGYEQQSAILAASALAEAKRKGLKGEYADKYATYIQSDEYGRRALEIATLSSSITQSEARLTGMSNESLIERESARIQEAKQQLRTLQEELEIEKLRVSVPPEEFEKAKEEFLARSRKSAEKMDEWYRGTAAASALAVSESSLLQSDAGIRNEAIRLAYEQVGASNGAIDDTSQAFDNIVKAHEERLRAEAAGLKEQQQQRIRAVNAEIDVTTAEIQAVIGNKDQSPEAAAALDGIMKLNGGLVTPELRTAVAAFQSGELNEAAFVQEMRKIEKSQTEVGAQLKSSVVAAYLESFPDRAAIISAHFKDGLQVDIRDPQSYAAMDIASISSDTAQTIAPIQHKMGQYRSDNAFASLSPAEQQRLAAYELEQFMKGGVGVGNTVIAMSGSPEIASAVSNMFKDESISNYRRVLEMESRGLISGIEQRHFMLTVVEKLGPKAPEIFASLGSEDTTVRENAARELLAMVPKDQVELMGDGVDIALRDAKVTAQREASDALARATSEGREIPAFMQDEIYASAYNSAYAKEVNKLAEAEEKARSAKSGTTEAGTADAATSVLRSENRYVQRSGLDPRYLQSQILSAEDTAIRDAYSEASPALLRGMMRADVGGGIGGGDEFILDPVAQERDRINFNAELKLNESLYEMYTADPGRFASARPPSNEGLVREGAKKHMTQQEYTRLRKESPNLTYDQAMGQATAYAAAKLAEDAKLEPVGAAPEQPMELVDMLAASRARKTVLEELTTAANPLLAKAGEVGGPVLPSIMGQGSAKPPALGPVAGGAAVETPAADTTAEPPKPTAAQLELQALKERELAGLKAAAEQYAQDPARYDNAAPGSPEEKIKKDAFEHYVEEEMARLSGGVIDGSARYFDQAEAYAKAKLEEIAAKAKEAVPMVSADPAANAEEAEYQRLIALGESPEKARSMAKGIVAAGQTAVAAGVTTDKPAKKEEVAAKTTEEAAKEAAKPATEAGAKGGEEKTADAPAKENAALVAQAQTTPDGRVAGPV